MQQSRVEALLRCRGHVVSISNISKGMVVPGNGQVEFITQAIVFKPFKGEAEVVDGIRTHRHTRAYIPTYPFVLAPSLIRPSVLAR